MTQNPFFSQPQSQSTQQPSTDDDLNQFMDASDMQDKKEHDRLLSDIQQLRQDKLALQDKLDKLIPAFKELLSSLEKLRYQLPQTYHDILLEDKVKQDLLNAWNQKIVQFEANFTSSIDLFRYNRLLETIAQESPQKIQSDLTSPPIPNRKQEELQPQLAQPKGNQLQLQSQIEKLEKLVLKITQFQPSNRQEELQKEQLDFHSQMNIKLITIETELKEIKNYLIPNNQEDLSQNNIAPVEKSQDDNSQFTQETENHLPQVTPNNIEVDSLPQPAWISTYNRNPDSFVGNAEVTATDESIQQSRLGANQPVIFEKSRKNKGNYWITSGDNSAKDENYLVPKSNLKINEYNLKTVQLLFQCIGESPEQASKLTLIKPAIVILIGNEKWQLEEPGILQFD